MDYRKTFYSYPEKLIGNNDQGLLKQLKKWGHY